MGTPDGRGPLTLVNLNHVVLGWAHGRRRRVHSAAMHAVIPHILNRFFGLPTIDPVSDTVFAVSSNGAGEKSGTEGGSPGGDTPPTAPSKQRFSGECLAFAEGPPGIRTDFRTRLLAEGSRPGPTWNCTQLSAERSGWCRSERIGATTKCEMSACLIAFSDDSAVANATGTWFSMQF